MRTKVGCPDFSEDLEAESIQLAPPGPFQEVVGCLSGGTVNHRWREYAELPGRWETICGGNFSVRLGIETSSKPLALCKKCAKRQ
jgi:hypothetical protein